MILQGGFVISDFVFGCGDPTYNPSPVMEFRLFTQCSVITILKYLVSEMQWKMAWPIIVVSMKSP